MADILRRLAILAVNRASRGNIQFRSIFSSAGIGIDTFKVYREQHAARHAPSIDAFKKNFVDSIDKSNSPIFTEDLRNMIMIANSDQEIDILIQALKKYSSNKAKFNDFHFGSPVMRLLYAQNKTNLALELYLDDALKDVFNDSASALVLMNKLIEDKRYDDVIKVFECGSKRGFSTSSGRNFPTDVVMLAIESLYRKNTKESYLKAKELIQSVKQRDSDINPRTAGFMAMLCIQQGEPTFAMEILTSIRAQGYAVVKNLRAICYADMGRVEEAINIIQLLAEQTSINTDRRGIFPLTMRHIRLAAEKSNDANLLARFEELSKLVLKNNRLSTMDLPEYISQPIERRGPSGQGKQNLARSNFKGNMGGSRNREGFTPEFRNFRQGNFGQPNRQFAENNRDYRFGNNFQRRLPYSDGYRRSYENDRFSMRGRSGSFNEFSRQDNRNQKGNQSFPRVNRNESAPMGTRRTPSQMSAGEKTQNETN